MRRARRAGVCAAGLVLAAAVVLAPRTAGASTACADVRAGDAMRLPAARAPRVVLLQGSLGIVTMAPFGAFLAGMGYPERALVDSRTGAMTSDSDLDGRALAGMLASYYERAGVRPLMVGHSKGGGVVIEALRALAGAYGDQIPVVDPRTGDALARTRFRDPLTGEERPVVGLRLPFAAAIATGRLPRVLRGQFALAARLRDVPDSAETFAGFAIPFDPIAGTLAGDEDPYRAVGQARVRNVVLPASTSHIGLPRAEHLARDPVTRAWIDAFRPDAPAAPPEGVDTENLVHAAYLWHEIKLAWCGEAERAAQRGG